MHTENSSTLSTAKLAALFHSRRCLSLSNAGKLCFWRYQLFGGTRKARAILARHESTAVRIAFEENGDVALVKAIIFVESKYNAHIPFLGGQRTCGPMNVDAALWGGHNEIQISAERIRSDPEQNIRAGIRILKLISRHTPVSEPNRIALIASEYGTGKTGPIVGYGAMVAIAYHAFTNVERASS